MKRIDIFILFLIAGLSTHLHAQQTLGLSGAITLALENNYDIRVIQLDESISEKNNSWGQAGMLPSLDLSASGTQSQSIDPDDDWTQQRGLGSATLSWTLFRGFSVWIQKAQLSQLEELSAGNTALLVEQTMQAVILAYYNVLLQNERLQVLDTVRQVSNDRYTQVLEKKEIGALVTYDVLQAKNAWLEDEARFLQQETTARNAVRDLNYLMGISEDQSYAFTDPFELDWQLYSLDLLRERMLADNRQLRNKFIQQQLLNSQVQLSKSAWSPSLSLRAGAETSLTRSKTDISDWADSDSRNAYGTLTLNWNLFNGGNRKRAIDIAKLDREIGEVEIASIEHSLSNRLAAQLDLYNVREKLLSISQEALETAELNLQISEEKFKSGAINSFNFRDVQLIYLNAALGRLESIYRLIEAHTELLRLTGGIVSSYAQ
ncbi:TolC family protein [candidate division KSB1 bacterium]|nr:TolC family protein [candidate division KSB1 bacterium]